MKPGRLTAAAAGTAHATVAYYVHSADCMAVAHDAGNGGPPQDAPGPAAAALPAATVRILCLASSSNDSSLIQGIDIRI